MDMSNREEKYQVVLAKIVNMIKSKIPNEYYEGLSDEELMAKLETDHHHPKRAGLAGSNVHFIWDIQTGK